MHRYLQEILSIYFKHLSKHVWDENRDGVVGKGRKRKRKQEKGFPQSKEKNKPNNVVSVLCM